MILSRLMIRTQDREKGEGGAAPRLVIDNFDMLTGGGGVLETSTPYIIFQFPHVYEALANRASETLNLFR
jgi:hypothetical protein